MGILHSASLSLVLSGAPLPCGLEVLDLGFQQVFFCEYQGGKVTLTWCRLSGQSVQPSSMAGQHTQRKLRFPRATQQTSWIQHGWMCRAVHTEDFCLCFPWSFLCRWMYGVRNNLNVLIAKTSQANHPLFGLGSWPDLRGVGWVNYGWIKKIWTVWSGMSLRQALSVINMLQSTINECQISQADVITEESFQNTLIGQFGFYYKHSEESKLEKILLEREAFFLL